MRSSIFFCFCLVILCLSGNTTIYAFDYWAPDFLIIGAQKSGTTALHRLLMQHPSIIKRQGEIHFFDVNYQRGTQWYQEQFPRRKKVEELVGDKSPYYMFHPLVPERVFRHYPHTKLIAILRDPVERAYSQYWHNLRAGRPPILFEEALEIESGNIASETQKILKDPLYNSLIHRHHSYLSRGIYADQLELWLSYFPAKQLLVLKSEDLRQKPQKVLNKVFHFLGVPPVEIQVVRPDLHHNYEPMDPILKKKLKRFFKPHNYRLKKFTGIDFNKALIIQQL